LLGLLGIAVSLATVAFALVYAIRPRERLLIAMRPLTLAAVFGGLSSFTFGLTTILRGVSALGGFSAEAWSRIAAGLAVSVAGLFVAFGCLTIAWLLVALGLRRVDV
jgi:hypothetical protein